MWLGVALAAVVVFSVLPGTVSAAPCAPGSLQSYIDALAGCEIGAVTVSDFFELSPPTGATPIDPSTITVTPLADGLQLGFSAAATAGEFFDVFFGFLAADTLGGVSLAINGVSATADGSVSAIEDLCHGAAFVGLSCGGTTSQLVALALAGDTQATDSTTFPPVTLLGVLGDIGIDGALDGSATLETATFRFQSGTTAAVPNPPSALLLSLAIVGCWLAQVSWRSRM